MRNGSRVILAEDNREQAGQHARFLVQVGGYEVVVARRGDELLALLDRTQAGWLLLDLELEDGFVVSLVPRIREAGGPELLILILTAYYDNFTDTMLFEKGVNEVLHKPYRPEDVFFRMRRMEEQRQGRPAGPGRKVISLRLGPTRVDLRNGQMIQGEEQTVLPDSLLRMLQILARREAGQWKALSRGDLLVRLWGKEVADDTNVYGDRLRALIYRVRNEVGAEWIQAFRGPGNSSMYVLSAQVQTDGEEELA